MLLLEAGGRNDDKSLRIDGKRWTTFMEKNMNWGDRTTPQSQCNDRQIDYSRGKGLGGGSAINFGLYTTGARDDYDQWAAEVGDDTFRWNNMQRRFKSLETFDGAIHDPAYQKYAKPNALQHGMEGALRLSFATGWEKDLKLVLDAFEEMGHERNLDHNSGNPLGMALGVNSAFQGRRTTAADLLVDTPDNLVIITDNPVSRVILRGNNAIGVEACGKQCRFLIYL